MTRLITIQATAYGSDNAGVVGGRVSINRTIAAILAADVVGFSRLVADREEETLERMAAYMAAIRETVAEANGRVFNTAGDAVLAEFPSAVLAVKAALSIQEEIAARNAALPPERRLQFRMGITIGDVVQQDGDLLGDAVNVASRLQGLAPPGGICVSRSVQEAVGTKVDARLVSLGRHRLKNLPGSVPVFRVVPRGAPGSQAGSSGWRRAASAALGLLIVAGIGAAWFFQDNLFGSLGSERAGKTLTSEQEAAARAAMTVSVVQPQRRCFQDTVRVSGIVAPREETEIRPDRDGLQITQVLAEPLAEVAAGDALVHLAAPDGRAAGPIVLRAPVAGTIGKSTAAVGAFTAVSAPPLFSIINRGDMVLAAEAPLGSLERLRAGQAATVRAVGGAAIQGRVRRISSVADYGSQLASVTLELPRDPTLRWGVFARGVVTIGERCGLAVPFSAVLREAEGPIVFVVSNAAAEARPVKIGFSSETEVELTDGLTGTEQVVQRAGPFLREGDRVRTVAAR
ncbi:MAG: hypothetical protein JWQ36_2849 [Enterovirga sp.]|nr:hypothetical protein [Enterovirga sp.]